MRRILFAVVATVMLLAAACGPGGGQVTDGESLTPTAHSPASATPGTPEASGPAVAATGSPPPTPSGPVFLVQIEAGLEDHEGFERAVFTFTQLPGQDGSERTLPPAYDVDVLEEYGILRVHLVDVPAGDTQQVTTVERSGLITHVYQAAAMLQPYPHNDTWVDLHTTQPVQAHVVRRTDPAQLVVDLEPVDGQWGAPADRHRGGVLLEPDPGSTHRRQVTLEGYANPHERFLKIRVQDADGNLVHEADTTTATWGGSHGTFETTIDVADWQPGTYRIVAQEESPAPATADTDPLVLETQVNVE